MKILKERNYVKEIEELFVPFFELHPTKDLNELFAIMKKQEKECSVSTSKLTILEDARLTETIDLFLSKRTDEIKGNYTIHQSSRYEFGEKKKEESRNYPIVFTCDGICVREEVEITEEDEARLEQFKFLIQLIDLSEVGRKGLAMDSSDISESDDYKRKRNRLSYSLGYKADEDHDIVTTVKKQFDIEKANSEISFTGRCSTSESNDGFSTANQSHSIRLVFGDHRDVETVLVTGSMDFH